MADDQVTKINLELNASVKNLADLQDAEKRIAALIAAYRKLSEAAGAGQRAATARGGKDYSAGLEVSKELGNARASLEAIDDISRRLPGGLAKAGPAGKTLADTVTGLKSQLEKIASPSGPGSAAAVGATLGQAAKFAEQKVSRLTESLDELQRPATASGKKGVPADPGGKLAQAEKLVRELQQASGKVSKVTETQKEYADFTGKKAAAQDSAKAAGVEATAKKETAKASTVTAKATKEIAASSEKIATAAKATTAATKETVKASPKKVAAEVAKAAAVPTNQPAPAARAGTRLSSRVPAITDASIQRDLARVNISARKGPVQAEAKLDKVAASADKAAAGLDKVGAAAKSTTEPDLIARRVRPAGQRTPESIERYAASQANTRWGRSAAGRSASGGGAGAAAQGTQNAARAAAQFSSSADRAAKSAASLSNGFRSISSSSGAATAGIQRVAKSQDAIFGSVKNVLGMAAGYQVLQGIATELGQVFGHLKGGIIGFNAMIEQTTVGFTTLFTNQAQQLLAMGEGMTEADALAADLSGNIDYIQMGYTDAASAAGGMIETIREFANVTPFRFAELQESALRMRAFGFELQEVLNKNKETGKFEGGIVAVGNAVSALGGGADAFRRITYALGQMKQAGRVYQNDMMQLANAGIGGYRYIARQLQKEITKDGSGSASQVKAGQEKLFNQLEANAIETVRRLTTTGQISGEAAARAILSGLEEDFGGGMEAQAKTFTGAFSTVADTSQSLVADAFKPLYDSIRDTTYELGQFLQKDDVRESAMELSKVIGTLTEGLAKLGKIVKDVVVASYRDLVGAISGASDKTKSLGFLGTNVFGGFINGIMTVTEMLKNDFARQLLYAAGLVKLLFAFGAANPLLTSILAVVTAVGVLRQAYDQNFLGFGKAIDDIATNFGPLIMVLRDEIIPLISEVGAIFTSSLFTVVIAGFEAMEPAITLVIGVLKHLLKFVKEFETPVKIITTALLAAFAGSKLIMGLTILSRMIQNLSFQFANLGRNAISAQAAIASGNLIPRAFGGMPISYVGAAGPSTRLAAGGGGSAMTGVAMGVGMAGMIGGSMAEAAGAPEWITSTVQNVSTALFGFAALKAIVPAGTFSAAINGLKNFLGAIKAYALVNWVGLSASLVTFRNSITSLPLIGPVLGGLGVLLGKFATNLGGIVRFIMSIPGIMFFLGSAAASGGAGLFPNFDQNRPGSLTAPGGPLDLAAETRARNTAERKPTVDLLDSLGRSMNLEERLSPETEKLFREKILPQVTGKDFFGNTKDLQKVMEEQMQEKTLLFGSDEEKAAFAQKEEQRIAKVRAAYYEYLSKVRMYVESRSKYGDGTGKNLDLIKKTNDQMALLINQQKEVNGNNDYLQWRLAKVKDAYQEAVDMVKTLATQTMQRLLNPESMVNPYTGLEEAGLTMEEIMRTEQEMGFAQFENQSGLTRSFEEYRDILESIKPLTDADMVNGKISLKAVERRMSIEKERRKELERIRALAEAEYDIGLATLQQYDESVDPLQRAVNLRNAQKKYAEDIEGLQFGGIGNILDEAKASDEWTAATRATKKRLQDFKQGQEMILQEMTNMFNEYSEDVANILSNPKLSASQRVDAVKLRMEKLYTDLETQFGITRTMLTEQIGVNNIAIDGALDALDSPTLPDINWGGEMATNLQVGGFQVLEDFLKAKAILLAQLSSAAIGAATGDISPAMKATRDDLVKSFKLRLAGWNLKGGPGAQAGRLQITRQINEMANMTNFENLIEMSNRIRAALNRFGLEKGGTALGGRMHLVGERGPELFVPRSNGMVLSNSISSRLMGMLGGAGSSGTAGNVTININNPVIRNENDIRKLAQEISRVQASQFRTEGGRL